MALAGFVLDPNRAFQAWWALLPVTGAALLLSAPAAWGCRVLLASPPVVWIGLISYPFYFWPWPLLVFFAIIKFEPLTLLERELVLCLSVLLAWLTYRLVETPIRFSRPSSLRIAGLCSAMVLIAVAGGLVVRGRGFDFQLPPEIREMADVRTDSSKWRFHQCLLDLSHEISFADACVDRDRRPLILVWGDSTPGALLPGLRKAQETRAFGIAQFTSSSCVPVLNTDMADAPTCDAINDRGLSLVRGLKAESGLLH